MSGCQEGYEAAHFDTLPGSRSDGGLRRVTQALGLLVLRAIQLQY